MSSLHLFKAPPGAPLFPRVARTVLRLGVTFACAAAQAADIATPQRLAGDFQAVAEAVVEAIESEGLVVSPPIAYGRMLERTALALDRRNSPFAQAAIIQFCSARLAWQLIEEDHSQLALCPLSIAIYAPQAEPGIVLLAYRLPEETTPGRVAAATLLRKIVTQVIELSGR